MRKVFWRARVPVLTGASQMQLVRNYYFFIQFTTRGTVGQVTYEWELAIAEALAILCICS